MDTELDRARKDALSLLRQHKVGVLSTASEGHLHGSAVYYTVDNDFNIYILTLVNTRKYAALTANPQVAFTVFDAQVPRTLQLEGRAMDITLDQEAAKKKEELFDVLNSNPWFYGPITKLDIVETAVVWIRPTWVRWADYAFSEAGSERLFKEIPIS
ncbi:MAG: pyridoxamine 5'-phosphate oxidase family protein [Patescibacteria group bacterium]